MKPLLKEDSSHPGKRHFKSAPKRKGRCDTYAFAEE